MLQLQKRIKKTYNDSVDSDNKNQIVIYGQHGHAEVNGLVGQTNGKAIVVEEPDELAKINFSNPVILYSQTTKSVEGYKNITERIKKNIEPGVEFQSYDTICRHVANRVEKLRNFALEHDIILFVSDNKSSNGKYLFSICKESNPKSYFISNEREIDMDIVNGVSKIGICGATSTPRWLMEKVKQKVNSYINANV